MGAMEFTVISKGKDATDAFHNACQEAAYDHGHSGYTGTIAEKPSFRMCDPLPQRMIDSYPDDIFGAAEAYADYCMEWDDEDKTPFWDDKWGDAACFQVNENHWCFFGWASS